MKLSKGKLSMFLAVMMVFTFMSSTISTASGAEVRIDQLEKKNSLEKEEVILAKEYEVIRETEFKNSPLLEGEVLVIIEKGTVVERLENLEGEVNKDFIKVQIEEQIGYILKEDLEELKKDIEESKEENEELEEIKTTESNGMEYRTIRELELKEGNSKECSNIANMAKGSTVKHLGTTENNWFKVEFNGKKGYVHRTLVTSKKNYDKNFDFNGNNSNGNNYKTIKTLPLRVGNSNIHPEVVSIPRGSTVKHLGTADNNWFKVEFNGEEGYIHRTLVTATQNYDRNYAIKTTPSNGRSYRVIMNLKLKDGNSDKELSIAEVQKGSYVRHLGTTNNDWFKVEYNGVVGYINRTLVTSKENYDKNFDFNENDSNGNDYKTIKTLSLRAGNSNIHSEILKMAKGSTVKHLGTTDNDWFKVEFNGQEGYIHRKLVTSIKSYDKNYAVKMTPSNGRTYRTITDLKIRGSNSDKDSSIAEVQKGSYIKHLGTTKNGWFMVDFNGVRGYLNRQFVTSESNYDRNYNFNSSTSNGNKYRTIQELNLRLGNLSSFPKVARIPKGSYVEHLGTAENDWFMVKFNGKKGFLHRTNLTSEKNYQVSYSDTRYKATRILRVRRSMSNNSSLVTKVPRGRIVKFVRSYKNGWAKIEYNNKVGYVKAASIKLSRKKIGISDNVTLKNRKNTVRRQRLVNASLSLVDKVPYFWGGKSYSSGWNSGWNTLRKVTSPGTSDYKKYIPYGLDCSGFVKWAFKTAGMGSRFPGEGTYHQWRDSYSIRQSAALPGDLVFKSAPGNGINHIGIYVGKNTKGEPLVVHSSYSRGGVVITTLENSQLKYFRRVRGSLY